MTTTAVEIDQQARERAEGWVGDLGQKISEAEAVLATLGGFFGDDYPLGRAVVGAIGIQAREMKEQLPALRQAIRDLDPSFPA